MPPACDDNPETKPRPAKDQKIGSNRKMGGDAIGVFRRRAQVHSHGVCVIKGGATQVSTMGESLNIIGYIHSRIYLKKDSDNTEEPWRHLQPHVTVARGQILISIYMKYLEWSES